MEKSVWEAKRVIDTMNTELNYITLKFSYYYIIINIEVSNVIKKRLLSSVLNNSESSRTSKIIIMEVQLFDIDVPILYYASNTSDSSSSNESI